LKPLGANYILISALVLNFQQSFLLYSCVSSWYCCADDDKGREWLPLRPREGFHRTATSQRSVGRGDRPQLHLTNFERLLTTTRNRTTIPTSPLPIVTIPTNPHYRRHQRMGKARIIMENIQLCVHFLLLQVAFGFTSGSALWTSPTCSSSE